MAQWLDPEAPLLARALHDAGYATGHFGKWHMGGQRDVGEAPLITDYGFDASLTNFEGLGPRVLPLIHADDGTPPRPHALGSDKLGRGELRWEDRSKVTATFTQAALEFIEILFSSDTPYIFRHRLQPGECLLSNNVLHNRSGFQDSPGRKRLLFRARYSDRIRLTSGRVAAHNG